MDSFFVEVERLRKPELIGVPVAVGGVGTRGVIASASYEARGFGVRSAQPTAIARRLCPNLVVVSSDHGRYSEVSTEVFEIFRSYTPIVEGLSLDEAFLDVSGLRMHFASSVVVGEAIRATIRTELGLPASVGVAGVKFIAKLASEDAKPNGLRHVPVERQLEYLHALSVERMWGVGPATLAGLERLGIENIGDLATVDRTALTRAIGRSSGDHLSELANGRDPRPVVADSGAKSISVEETYSQDLESLDTVRAALLAETQKLSWRLRRAGLRARTINLKVRFSDFRTISRSRTVVGGLDGARELYKVSLELVDSVEIAEPVRLLGVGATGLESSSTPSQLGLHSSQEWDSVEDAVTGVKERFGENAVHPARLIASPEDPRDDEEP